ncbi:MAG: imidazole glycerol phosphate synthase subunit HisH [Spirochaetales bacterium]|nr:imidazole glycerol phosphate synthase subunit HisH [Spirochaetales bacterium]
MAKDKVAVVDYKAGNLKSVETALDYLGADFLVTHDPDALRGAARVIFPGVGEARASMEVLQASGLGQAIVDFFQSGRPLMGICLGTQIIFEHSEERDTACLGLVKGKVRRFPESGGLKIPQIGWNQVVHSDSHPVFKGIPENSNFYFVHSYYPQADIQEQVMARTEYGITFSSAVARDNLFASQFHPEKSGRWGLKLLENFLGWNP